MAAGGPPFFPDQQHLLELVLATRALAAGLDADISAHLPPERIDATLARPASIVVLGPVNAGKSTLINSLFRSPLATVSKLPETSDITVHHSISSKPPLHHPLVRSAAHSSPATLAEFAIIDTPGTLRLTPEQSQVLSAIADSCDTILAVLPTDNPWEPATWDLLSGIPPARLGNIILILQHADVRSDADICVMVGHIADLAVKRCGISPPVFPIAAPSPVTDSGTWRSSGCKALWDHLILSLTKSESRQSAIACCHTGTADALRVLDGHIDKLQHDLGSRNRALGHIQSDLDHILSHFIQSLESGMSHLAQALRSETTTIERDLRKRLGILPSMIRLFGRDNTAERTERMFLDHLQSAIRDVGKEDAQEITTSCLAHWKIVTDSAVKEELGDLCDNHPEKILADAEKRFVESLAKAASERLDGLHLRNRLDRELRRRNRALASYVATCLILLTLGAIAGSMDVPWLAVMLCLLAAGFLMGGMITGWITRPRVINAFHQHVTEACTSFAKALQTDYDEALRAMFRDYSTALHPLQSAIAGKESAIKPLQKRWQELFLRLKSLEQTGR